MTSRGPKLVAVVLVAIVVISGLGYWLFAPKMPSQPVNYSAQEISTASSASALTTLTEAIQWINVSAAKVQPVSYYLKMLESSETEPYLQLAKELQKLPDPTNSIAIAKIACLALNATNPDVNEAFELMMKGGTPEPRDFSYSVPSYNTELQVLYWLASQNEFKKDDTLVLAIAVVNGFWLTVGDEEVRDTLQHDVNDLLAFFRETNEMQRARGYYQLESYPLEAKICLAWRASITPNLSALASVWGSGYQDMQAFGYLTNGTKVTLEGYLWNTVTLDSLRTMRDLMQKNGWINKEPSVTIPLLEKYFYFSERHLIGHWEKEPVYIMVDGRLVHDYTIGNVNWQLDFYLRTGKFQGQCTDESQWIDAWAKSWGIATNTIWRGGYDSEGRTPPDLFYVQHFHPVFYDPASETWKASDIQLNLAKEDAGSAPLFFMIFRPPTDQSTYFSSRARTTFYPDWDWRYGVNPNMFYWHPRNLSIGEIRSMFSQGLQTSQFKQWIVYGEGSATIPQIVWRQEGVWNVLADGSSDLYGEEERGIVGDLGQRYVDVASLNASFSDGVLFVRLNLRDVIPRRAPTPKVSAIWYQVLLDVDSNPSTGLRWNDGFTADYMLQLYTEYDATSHTVREYYSYALQYSGNGKDWTWRVMDGTRRSGSASTLEGGLGHDFFTLACRYETVSVSKGMMILFFARSGLLYDGRVYNDPVPDNDIIIVKL